MLGGGGARQRRRQRRWDACSFARHDMATSGWEVCRSNCKVPKNAFHAGQLAMYTAWNSTTLHRGQYLWSFRHKIEHCQTFLSVFNTFVDCVRALQAVGTPHPVCTTAVPSKTLHANCCTTVRNRSLRPRASVATTPHSHLFRAALSIAPPVPPLPDSSTVIPCVPTATATQHSTFQTPSQSPPRSPSPVSRVASLSAVHVPGVHTRRAHHGVHA